MLTASSDTIGAMGKRILTEVDGLSVSLTTLDKPLFADGFTTEAISGSDGVIPEGPDEPASITVMVDLGHGPGVTLATTAQAAIVAATALAGLGLECFPKTSGNKGLQLSVPIAATPGTIVFHFAQALAHHLSRTHPTLFTAKIAKQARGGRVFVDYAQNMPVRNTICAYSVHGLYAPSVSTPLTWDEVGSLWKGGCMTTTPRPFSIGFTPWETCGRLSGQPRPAPTTRASELTRDNR